MYAIDPSPLAISLATTCAATIATFFLGLLAARLMYASQSAMRPWIDGILTLPLVLPPTVVGFFLLLIFGRHGPIGHLLEQIGVTIVFSWPATVIAATVVAFPLMYRTALGALEQVNPTLLQAARTLGASEWRVFRRVLLPLASPGVVAGAVLAFARALGEFGATLMLAGNIPGRTQTMPIAIFSAVERDDMHAAIVWVVFIVALSLAIIRLLNRQGAARRAWQPAAPADTLPLEAAARIAEEPRTPEDGKPSATLEIDVEKTLDNFTLQVQFHAGRGALGLLGASGAGKSMTLRLIAGVAIPDRGRIALNGKTLFDSASGIHIPPARRRIGVVFQDYALFPHMTVAENVAFGLHALPEGERRGRVRQQLDRMHIADLGARYPGELSGGQRQRVAIARCLAIQPDALLLDEPFAALDPHLRRQMEGQLREALASYNGVVVFVTHDMEEAFRFCAELLVLDEGRVIASGPKHALFEQPRTVVSARLTGCKNIAAARAIDAGRIAVDAWNCSLALAAPVSGSITHAGYRSHHFRFQQNAAGDNIFPCWLVETSEAPHEMTLYLRLHHPPQPGEPHHLQADIPKDQWRTLSVQQQPWQIQIDPGLILLLEENSTSANLSRPGT
ncbi:MAG: molybdate ABC transporter permease subunit [Acidobacteriota bacterium]|nr:molybdate ABC transporter permease subunit [Acidobacteriota bacterium]